jgi:hypothetical protein
VTSQRFFWPFYLVLLLGVTLAGGNRYDGRGARRS